MARVDIQGHSEQLRSNIRNMHNSCCSPPISGMVTVKLQPLSNALLNVEKFMDAEHKEEAEACCFLTFQLEQARHRLLRSCSACAQLSLPRGGEAQP